MSLAMPRGVVDGQRYLQSGRTRADEVTADGIDNVHKRPTSTIAPAEVPVPIELAGALSHLRGCRPPSTGCWPRSTPTPRSGRSWRGPERRSRAPSKHWTSA